MKLRIGQHYSSIKSSLKIADYQIQDQTEVVSEACKSTNV